MSSSISLSILDLLDMLQKKFYQSFLTFEEEGYTDDYEGTGSSALSSPSNLGQFWFLTFFSKMISI